MSPAVARRLDRAHWLDPSGRPLAPDDVLAVGGGRVRGRRRAQPGRQRHPGRPAGTGGRTARPVRSAPGPGRGAGGGHPGSHLGGDRAGPRPARCRHRRGPGLQRVQPGGPDRARRRGRRGHQTAPPGRPLRGHRGTVDSSPHHRRRDRPDHARCRADHGPGRAGPLRVRVGPAPLRPLRPSAPAPAAILARRGRGRGRTRTVRRHPPRQGRPARRCPRRPGPCRRRRGQRPWNAPHPRSAPAGPCPA